MPDRSRAQIYLNPMQQPMTRSRVSIDLGDGLRCSSDGGSVPTMSLSVGAYPDQWGGDNIIFESNRSVANQSSLLGLLSVNIPLNKTSQSFDCKALLHDAQIKARLANLRELVEENILSESQYRAAVIKLYGSLLDGKEVEKQDGTAKGFGTVIGAHPPSRPPSLPPLPGETGRETPSVNPSWEDAVILAKD